MTIDPLTQVYNKLWEALEANEAICRLVKPANRVKLTERSKIHRENYTHSDIPEVIIMPSGGMLNPHFSSTSAMVSQKYAVAVVDGNLILSKKFFPLKWALLTALADLPYNLGLGFVRRVQVTDTTDRPNEDKIPGWNTSFEIEVEMLFKHEDLKG